MLEKWLKPFMRNTLRSQERAKQPSADVEHDLGLFCFSLKEFFAQVLTRYIIERPLIELIKVFSRYFYIERNREEQFQCLLFI